MPAPPPWTPDDDATLRRLHAQDMPVRHIAEHLGRARSTVSHHARTLGLTFDRTRTRAATAARIADAQARRSILALALLEDAEKLRAQLFAPALVFNFGGRSNTYAEHTLDKPPFADQLKIAQALGALVDRHLRLEAHDADTGVTQITSMLESLFTAMGVPLDHPTP